MSEKEVPPFVGIDDEKHYQANVDAYRRSTNDQASNSNKIRMLKIKNKEERKKTFNEDLWEFDQVVEAYRSDEISMGDYLFSFVDSNIFSPNIEIFLEALKIERSLDFKRVEAERSHLISRLLEELDQNQTTTLINTSMAFRLGKMSHADFYAFIKKLCAKNKVPLHQFPAMADYLQYVLLSDRIDGASLFTEIKKAEKEKYKQLTKTKKEQELIQTSRQLF